ncbi:hypothetical protein BT63DRAFT_27818 [Microthyrium microscopicum]|uniref:Uncharacterized protein n=1 Tax=Microthyrium microscopicum TaxID=703497 RepID=A0A6A6UUE9_9PEZI|nr:hypothetical protein BT63DRAFT_27818 [Microthyrium microscopicum]
MRKTMMSLINDLKSDESIFLKGGSLFINFLVDVNCMEFFQKYYSEGSERPLHSIITLTGSPSHAQAVSIEQYVRQTWPLGGPELLDVVQKALKDTGQQSSATLLDGTVVRCEITQKGLDVLAFGRAPCLSETGELLSWLSAALISDNMTDRVAISEVLETPVNPRNQKEGYPEILIVSETRPSSLKREDFVNCCWFDLFEHATLIQGFPISPRPEGQRGLELSLPLMVTLGNADWLTDFQGAKILRGFSTMFVATDATSDSIQWHFMWDHAGNRIASSKAADLQAKVTSDKLVEEVESSARHFVGWTRTVKTLAGTEFFGYNEIGASNTYFSARGFNLRDSSLTVGKIVQGGMPVGRGHLNRSFHGTSHTSFEALIRAAQKNVRVSFYDSQDDRAWLVNGASAILLLTRTQLSHAQSPHSMSRFFEIDRFNHVIDGADPNAAVAALLDKSNWGLKVGEEPAEEFQEVTRNEHGDIISTKTIQRTKNNLLHEVIRKNTNLLFDLHDYQVVVKDYEETFLHASRQPGVRGWEFLDIIRGQSSLRPRETYLQLTSGGWASFTTEINAITIFASNFQGLLQPASGAELCRNWSQVPMDRGLMAVSISVLQHIRDEYSTTWSNKRNLVGNIYWPQQNELFEKCQVLNLSPSCCDRRQALWTVPKQSRRLDSSDPFQYPNGAVIFGQSSSASVTSSGALGGSNENQSKTIIGSEPLPAHHFSTLSRNHMDNLSMIDEIALKNEVDIKHQYATSNRASQNQEDKIQLYMEKSSQHTRVQDSTCAKLESELRDRKSDKQTSSSGIPLVPRR